MSTYEKAASLLAKLYYMRRRDFMPITVEDMLTKASPEEISFYYEKIIGE